MISSDLLIKGLTRQQAYIYIYIYTAKHSLYPKNLIRITTYTEIFHWVSHSNRNAMSCEWKTTTTKQQTHIYSIGEREEKMRNEIIKPRLTTTEDEQQSGWIESGWKCEINGGVWARKNVCVYKCVCLNLLSGSCRRNSPTNPQCHMHYFRDTRIHFAFIWKTKVYMLLKYNGWGKLGRLWL